MFGKKKRNKKNNPISKLTAPVVRVLNPVVGLIDPDRPARAPAKNPGRRSKNPPPGMGAALTFLGIGLAGGAAYLWSTKASAKKGKKKKKACAPYTYVAANVRQAVAARIDAGSRDAGQIAIEVSNQFFGDYPGTGELINFPPDEIPKKGVQCVWDKVVDAVYEVFDEKGITPDGQEDGVPFDEGGALDPGYPWEHALIHSKNAPTPGMFAIVSGSDEAFDYSKGFGAMSKYAVNSAIAMAAAAGVDSSTAASIMQEDANKSARKRDLIESMKSLIACGHFNGTLYGTSRPDKAYIGYLRQNLNNITRMSMGEKAKRSIKLNGYRIDGISNATYSPQFWIPAINLDRLGGPNPIVTVQGMAWSDGSSTIEPPPAVQALGVTNSGIAVPPAPNC